ncbi:M48 family metalloprotease [bacterium]|jgi:Zn-dependent protease with chaperone function|nr:M48 family metalloprotease [bacterium]
MKFLKFLIISLSLLIAQEYELKLKNGKTLKGEVDESTLELELIKFKLTGAKFGFDVKRMEIDFIKKNGNSIFKNEAVIANVFSKKIHKPLTNHDPREEDALIFETLEDAKLEGFSECISCFDMRPRLSNYYLEMDLRNSLYGVIIQQWETLYDHPKLEKTQELLKKVLVNWTEEIKYDNYRIEILKSTIPFSWSLPGGSIYISSELLDMCEYDSEIEVIIAREVAHVERRHLLRSYQKSESDAAGIAIALTFISLATQTDMSSVMESLGQFSYNLLGSGFSRKLEEEADALAMIYLLRNDRDKNALLRILEKLKFRTNTRVGSTNRLSAFTNAPDLVERIKQIKTAKLVEIENQIILVANHLNKTNDGKKFEQGFISLSFNYIFIAESSTNKTKSYVNLIGTAFNSEFEESFRLDPLEFMPSISGQSILVEMNPIILESNSSTNFGIKLFLESKDVDVLIERIKNNYPLLKGARISRIKTNPGAKEKTIDFEKITASFSFN